MNLERSVCVRGSVLRGVGVLEVEVSVVCGAEEVVFAVVCGTEELEATMVEEPEATIFEEPEATSVRGVEDRDATLTCDKEDSDSGSIPASSSDANN